ncbi:MAG TPA: polyphosphate polymerase domain-containing protein [Acidimicrobiales bacterium]|nr:polyphosphate polymerase domain-containing protein [Acidimicrobiales bacterium]
MSVVTVARQAPAALSLDEVLAVADLQTRTDRKYVVEPEVFARLVATLGAGLGVLEIGGLRSFRYESVYFDTPALDSYLGAAHGRRRRFKVRTRSYLDSGDSMLEVKTRSGRGETVKTRMPYDIGRRSCLDAAGLEFVRLHAALPAGATLAPVLTTAYSRATYVELATGSRLTCDMGLVCASPAGAAVSLPDELLVETKSAGAPTAADRFLWRAGVRPVAISKFCVGMAALDPTLPANKWNRILRRHFDRTPGRL